MISAGRCNSLGLYNKSQRSDEQHVSIHDAPVITVLQHHYVTQMKLEH